MLETLLINTIVIALCVFIHFEVFRGLIKFLPTLQIKQHFKVLIAVFVALLAHTLEVWLFGFTFYLQIGMEGLGSLVGNFDGSLLDCVYFSITCYTSVGFGDIEPLGPLRFTAGFEALAGLTLITWSASFLFIEMQRYWLFDQNNS